MRLGAGVQSGVLGVAGFGYLALTGAPDLQPFDSAELALNAVQLGVGHPPGQPLYLLLGAALVRALPAEPSRLLALLSAAAMVAACVVALHLGRSLAAPSAVASGGAAASKAGEPSPSPSPTAAGWLCVLAPLAALCLPGAWDLSTRAEVYTLAALLSVGGGGVILLPVGPGGRASWRLAAGALLIAASASVNPAMAVAMALAVTPAAVYLLWSASWRERSLAVALAVAAGVIGLAPYGLLPLLGGNPGDALVWGEPLSGDALWHYLLGRDYRAWQLADGELGRNLVASLSWLSDGGLAPWLLVGAAGWLAADLPWPSRIALPLGAALSLLLLALNHPFVPSNPDYHGYLLPPALLAVAGVVALLGSRVLPRPRGAPLALALVAALALGGATSGPPLPARDRSQARLTRTLATLALEETPHRGILLLESDHLVFPALYLQEVEGRRPDVVVLNHGWSSSGWFWRHLRARHPDLPAPPPARSRNERVARFAALTRRPVVAEDHRLLPRPPSVPTAGGLLMPLEGAAPSPTACAPIHAGAPSAGEPFDEADLPALLAAWAAAVAPGDLDERLLAFTALARGDRAWLAGQPLCAARILVSALRPERRAGLPEPTAAAVAHAAFHDHIEPIIPRALVPPDLLLVRLGDLLARSEPAAAARYYARAEVPEAARGLARLQPSEAPGVHPTEAPAVLP